MTFRGVVRSPAYLQVAEQIRAAILSGELAPGQPLPTERDLCAQFSVSRTTVREALRALQAQGLVSGGGRTTPLRTTVAAEPPSEPLRDALHNLVRLQRVSLADLVELRCALEAAAVERAAAHPQADRLAEARAALDDMRRLDISAEEFEDADVRFHVALVAASGNEAMHLIMLAVRDAIAEHLRDALHELPRSRAVRCRLTDQHAALLAAVEKGDAEQAGSLTREHIMDFYRRFPL
ncbi:MAG: FadR family transcriptional regulator [Pseudonocardiales bacterium]|nr:FadR family transcriptional regulator [Pseudonocardiales bacterium]MBV9730352.1 FadR family transcriptional regulator [Pseudonocardiales bacterium]